MTESIDQLRQDYRDIEAPAHLASRIRANVDETARRPHGWMPVAATAMVAVAALFLLPYLGTAPQSEPPKTLKPSLSALATLRPDKPKAPAPSLSGLRSVKVPKLPPKPTLTPSGDPQPSSQFESELMEENDHAHS